MPSIIYGGAPAPVWRRPWRLSRSVADGFRVIADLRPGQHWSEARIEPRQFEAHVDLEAGPAPVGVAIAAELVRDGAEWAFSTEMYLNRPLVLLDQRAMCCAIEGGVARTLDALRAANGGSIAGLPDVVASCGDVVVLREAKRAGKDKLSKKQQQMGEVARQVFVGRLDLAVVEWELERVTN